MTSAIAAALASRAPSHMGLKLIDGGASVGWLGDERAALVDEQVLHLRDGGLAAYGW